MQWWLVLSFAVAATGPSPAADVKDAAPAAAAAPATTAAASGGGERPGGGKQGGGGAAKAGGKGGKGGKGGGGGDAVDISRVSILNGDEHARRDSVCLPSRRAVCVVVILQLEIRVGKVTKIR